MSDVTVERIITSGAIGAGRPGLPPDGIFLENNVWLVGDHERVLVIDAAHDARAIAAAVGDREPLGILLTHGHEDHVNAALDTAALLDTHLYLHPADLFIWRETHGDAVPDFELADGAAFQVAGVELITRHTPGHTPGSVCFVAPALGTVFSGDTLFNGGPGATRWEYSSFPQIIDSIQTSLFSLPPTTIVQPGHGEFTEIAAEQPALAAWLARGQ
ncbi:MBL fold metallo-hydrolase [Leucobacter luti]|uniref:Glyoxylase-like metal-dependent hydrolase (Beta-lactamase superfamily II) n=1 Tax=Leucobacter luti TaxID=340320 RepID=A0A4Q7TLJ5_9MICO|nr:MBL fold metallo-hydrolase [Leucobacter luti]MBL3700407.1 MBL fold metallo-hydrolase [Leucobacter luti]RZT60578.1 glyoxylase-like metal-dependent hydrolase (beta-lactamase superfamily II) [Leucobacter luti]